MQRALQRNGVYILTTVGLMSQISTHCPHNKAGTDVSISPSQEHEQLVVNAQGPFVNQMDITRIQVQVRHWMYEVSIVSPRQGWHRRANALRL